MVGPGAVEQHSLINHPIDSVDVGEDVVRDPILDRRRFDQPPVRSFGLAFGAQSAALGVGPRKAGWAGADHQPYPAVNHASRHIVAVDAQCAGHRRIVGIGNVHFGDRHDRLARVPNGIGARLGHRHGTAPIAPAARDGDDPIAGEEQILCPETEVDRSRQRQPAVTDRDDVELSARDHDDSLTVRLDDVGLVDAELLDVGCGEVVARPRRRRCGFWNRRAAGFESSRAVVGLADEDLISGQVAISTIQPVRTNQIHRLSGDPPQQVLACVERRQRSGDLKLRLCGDPPGRAIVRFDGHGTRRARSQQDAPYRHGHCDPSHLDPSHVISCRYDGRTTGSGSN